MTLALHNSPGAGTLIRMLSVWTDISSASAIPVVADEDRAWCMSAKNKKLMTLYNESCAESCLYDLSCCCWSLLGTNFRIALIWTARLIEIAGRLHEIAQDSDLDEQMADFSLDFERERDF